MPVRTVRSRQMNSPEQDCHDALGPRAPGELATLVFADILSSTALKQQPGWCLNNNTISCCGKC